MPLRPASEFGRKFREAREAAGVSQAEIARRLKMDGGQAYISRVEAGQHTVTLDMCAALWKTLRYRFGWDAIPEDEEANSG